MPVFFFVRNSERRKKGIGAIFLSLIHGGKGGEINSGFGRCRLSPGLPLSNVGAMRKEKKRKKESPPPRNAQVVLRLHAA